jgi:hypothetical protein
MSGRLLKAVGESPFYVWIGCIGVSIESFTRPTLVSSTATLTMLWNKRDLPVMLVTCAVASVLYVLLNPLFTRLSRSGILKRLEV